MKIDFEKLKDIREARKKRHARTFVSDESVFVQETNRQIEQVFFWRVLTLSTLGLFFFSIVPQFATSMNFQDEDLQEIINEPRESIVFSEDGFMMKPEVWTETGDRSDVGGVIDHVVEAGESLSVIAERFGVKQETILQNNPTIRANALKPGTVLKIPAADGLVHKVKPGETIGSLAKKYKVDAQKILAQNEMESDSVLIAGQEIIIPGAKRIVARPARTPSRSAPYQPGAGASARDTGGTLLFPTQGVYTQGFHYGHYAVDIAKAGGAPIWASEAGTVIRAQGGWNGGYGNYVIIDHGNGMQTLYAHQRYLSVKKGDWVARGQQIGYMGNTGRVRGRTGVHLHFEVRINGRKVNPKKYF